ncbi:hypothetical protein [Rhodovulum marinum]|uniref:Uncharacterized protein n=1 Tax=Rhodovulum marinum TaxID=320662 RepID=A0A4R2Q5E2_9RHOB|nr:hypothetical protein [Rhodovulum marinum]TCP43154.1 hypothetical protein EV662_102348 [Rhodovulum marinum]
MQQDGQDALEEVATTLEELQSYLTAVETRLGIREPQFAQVRRELATLAGLVRSGLARRPTHLRLVKAQ